jgi:cold shock CspA family protein
VDSFTDENGFTVGKLAGNKSLLYGAICATVPISATPACFTASTQQHQTDTMRKQGTVVRWNGTRAFGFIKSDQTPADIFFHLRDFSGALVPTEGLQVGFEEIHVGGKGPRAMHVRPLACSSD